MNLDEKMKAMESKKSRNMDLVQFRKLLDRHLPAHRRLKMIQVAGTNGKGSTCTWLRLFLSKMGYKTGLFTSPHLLVHNERISINNTPISNQDWEFIYDMYRELFEEHHFTMFEMDLFMALAYFIEQKVDYAIIEVGLGGRKDASTALDYIATLLTNIGLEHTELLGDTKEKIAFEKSGIFKTHTLAITSEEDPACLKVLMTEAKAVQAYFYRTSRPEYTIEGNKLFFPYLDGTLVFNHPLYQLKNYILACEALYHLKFHLRYPLMQEAIDEFQFQGRFMKIQNDPEIIVDGAHNVHGIQALVNSIPHFDGTIYFSALKEKDVFSMINLLKTISEDIVLVHFDNERIYPFEAYGYKTISLEDMFLALSHTKKRALVCGSLYFVGDVIKKLGHSQ